MEARVNLLLAVTDWRCIPFNSYW